MITRCSNIVNLLGQVPSSTGEGAQAPRLAHPWQLARTTHPWQLQWRHHLCPISVPCITHLQSEWNTLIQHSTLVNIYWAPKLEVWHVGWLEVWHGDAKRETHRQPFTSTEDDHSNLLVSLKMHCDDWRNSHVLHVRQVASANSENWQWYQLYISE